MQLKPLPAPVLALQRRVVVTGLGAVSPLGCGMQATWKNLLEGKSGIRQILPQDNLISPEHLDQLPTKTAALVPRSSGYCTEKNHLFDDSKWKFHPRFIQYALEATEEALLHSKWNPPIDSALRNRAGVSIGSGIGCLEETIAAQNAVADRGPGRISPHFVPKTLLNMAAGHVSLKFNLRGPNICATTACAAGSHSIGDAYRLIKFGEADIMISGGVESCINVLSIGGFGKMRALSTRTVQNYSEASCPFDRARDGFVIGEGAAILVLEEFEHALARGANILAEIRGCGLSGDAYHPTRPPEDGEGAKRAMLAAITQGNITLEQIGAINAHATSTPHGDAAEARAIDCVFKGRSTLLVSSTKGATGHLLGAAGALEAAFTVLSIHEKIIPHTLNLVNPDPAMSFTYVKNQPFEKSIDAALSNSFGFGGTNASLLFSRI